MNGLSLRPNNLLLGLRIEETKEKWEGFSNSNKNETSFQGKLKDESPRECYRAILTQRAKGSDGHSLSLWYNSNRQHNVSFIRKLCERYHLKDNTYYSALSYCDRMLRSSPQLTNKEFDLKIIGCFLLAAKFAENDAFELDISAVRSNDLSIVYERRSLKESEIRCLQELNYDLGSATILDVLMSQIACGVLFKDEIFDVSLVNSFVFFIRNNLRRLTKSTLSITYEPEVIGLSLIQLGRCYLNLSPKRISDIMVKLQFTNEKRFELCYKEIKDFFNRTSQKNHIPIRTSYGKLKVENKLKAATISSAISNNITSKALRHTIKAQSANKMTLTILSIYTNRTKGTSCSTKQNSSSTLSNTTNQNKHFFNKKSRSNSTKPNLCCKSKETRLTLSLKCSLPPIEQGGDCLSKKIMFKSRYNKGIK